MSADPVKLARLLLVIAADLDRRCYPATGALRVAAGLLATSPPPAEGCPVCGEAVEQPRTGRPRIYCSRRCKDRATRRPRGTTAA